MKPTNFRTPERWNSVPVPPRVAERAYTRRVVDDDGCWISTYSVASHGYAQIGWTIPVAERGPDDPRSHMVLAHRAAWSHLYGQVPLGMTLDHLCKQRRCVNPEHMRLLPNYENARRTKGRDWPLGYCVHGHDSSHLIEVGRKANRSGVAKICGACQTARQAEYRDRKRNAA